MRERVLALLFVAVLAGACGSYADPASVEYKLAAIDAHGPPSDGDVLHYAVALDSLENKCPDSRVELGEMAKTAQQEFAKQGKQYSLLETLQLVDSVMQSGAQPWPSCTKNIRWGRVP
jgi:hypothetical protein